MVYLAIINKAIEYSRNKQSNRPKSNNKFFFITYTLHQTAIVNERSFTKCNFPLNLYY